MEPECVIAALADRLLAAPAGELRERLKQDLQSSAAKSYPGGECALLAELHRYLDCRLAFSESHAQDPARLFAAILVVQDVLKP